MSVLDLQRLLLTALLLDRFTGDPERLRWQHRRRVQLEDLQVLGHVVGLALLLELAGLVPPRWRLLPDLLPIQLVQFLAGRRADALQPLVVADRLAAQRVVLELLRLLLYHALLDDRLLLIEARLDGGGSGRLQVLLELVAPFPPVQIALPYRYPLEGLAALEGRLVTVLPAAHEPPQVLERQRPHGYGPPRTRRSNDFIWDHQLLPRFNISSMRLRDFFFEYRDLMCTRLGVPPLCHQQTKLLLFQFYITAFLDIPCFSAKKNIFTIIRDRKNEPRGDGIRTCDLQSTGQCLNHLGHCRLRSVSMFQTLFTCTSLLISHYLDD